MYISFIPNGINFTADAYTISLLYPIACRHNAHYITLISFFIVAPPATQILCIYKLCIVVCTKKMAHRRFVHTPAIYSLLYTNLCYAILSFTFSNSYNVSGSISRHFDVSLVPVTSHAKVPFKIVHEFKKRQHISSGIYQILNGHSTISNAPAPYLLYIHFNSDLYTLISAVTPRISLFSSRIG